MGYLNEENMVHLAGKVLSEPVFSHKTCGEAFYLTVMGILRRSGYEDRIRVIIPEKLMEDRIPQPDEFMELCGQVRTYNRESEGHNRLEVTVFARHVMYEEESSSEYENRVMLEGYICKLPVRRTSPLGREICDLMIAVNRMYNKSDYIPTIAWGRNAVYGGSLEVGDKVALEGRIQSREYRKFTDEGEAVTKIAYEVSASRLELMEE